MSPRSHLDAVHTSARGRRSLRTTTESRPGPADRDADHGCRWLVRRRLSALADAAATAAPATKTRAACRRWLVVVLGPRELGVDCHHAGDAAKDVRQRLGVAAAVE